MNKENKLGICFYQDEVIFRNHPEDKKMEVLSLLKVLKIFQNLQNEVLQQAEDLGDMQKRCIELELEVDRLHVENIALKARSA
jgi:hypothetical protein